MSFCVEVCTILTEVFLAAYLFERMLTRMRPLYFSIIYYCLYGILIVVGTFFIFSVALRIGLLVVFSLLGNFLIYSSSTFSCIYITLSYYVSVLLSDLIGSTILSLHNISLDISIGGTGRLVYNALAKLIKLLLVQIIMLIFRRNRVRFLPYTGIPLLFCQILSAWVCYACCIALAEGDDSNVFLLIALCLLVINIVICTFVNLLQQFYENRTEAIAAEKQRDIQLQYYQDMLARQEETRALWHDIKKYFSAMKAMVEADRSPEAEACFHEIKAKFSQIDQNVDVGNRIVNSILSQAVKQANDISTQLEMDVWVSPKLNISSADLFIIIGNTLDNAIDACAEIPMQSRYIHIILKQTNQILYYEVTNPYTNHAKPKPGNIHGYGLRNVRECIEKNGGTIDVSTANNIYSIKIFLNV